jgi:hypothetical protein
VEEIEKRVLPDDGEGGLHPWSIEDAADVPGLTDRAQLYLPAAVVTTATEYVGRLATVSAYLTLDPQVRAETLRQVRAALPDHVETDDSVHLCLARRVSADDDGPLRSCSEAARLRSAGGSLPLDRGRHFDIVLEIVF